MSVKDYIDKAEHYKAIGHDDIYLGNMSSDDLPDDLPWEHVTTVECPYDGFDGNNSVQFKALHPCGLLFRWYLHVFEFGHPVELNASGIQLALTMLPNNNARALFGEHLLKSSTVVTEETKRTLSYIQGNLGKAALLHAMANTVYP